MMSLMNHSPAAEWSIRKTTDRSDPSCDVMFATTRFGPSIFAEADLIPPPFCSPVNGSASNTGKSLLCFIAAVHAWLKGGEKYLRMSGVGVLSKIGRQPPLLSRAASAFTDSIGTLSAARAGQANIANIRRDRAPRIADLSLDCIIVTAGLGRVPTPCAPRNGVD